MYTLSVKRAFIARHALLGEGEGKEYRPHSHRYVLELQLEGVTLDRSGYLVDILAIEVILDGLQATYEDQFLNDRPEFEDLNPSLERFARVLCQNIGAQLGASNLTAITVKLWESESAWASYRQEC